MDQDNIYCSRGLVLDASQEDQFIFTVKMKTEQRF